MNLGQALRIHRDQGRSRAVIEDWLRPSAAEGELVIRTRYSAVNYKDALAGTGRGPLIKTHPRIGGIDCVGEVEISRSPLFREGDLVMVSSGALGISHDGGYATWVCVPADWVLPLPPGLGPFEAIAIGTAGLSAALAIHRLRHNGQTPDRGPLVVTGATGGVGCLAIDMLGDLDYEVVAVTRKPHVEPFLRGLGVKRLITPGQIAPGERPLESACWAGAIDTVGGAVLAALMRTLMPNGNIASIGLAGGSELHTTVMPFILRGINLLGIDTAGCPQELRKRLWERLGSDLKPLHLKDIVCQTIPLEQLSETFERVLAGRHVGRILVQFDDEGSKSMVHQGESRVSESNFS
ncbi:putative quinone oxidoreductase YhfP [Gammaproteobacteria bacterium]